MIRNLVVVGIGGQGVHFVSTLLRKALGARYGRFTGYDERGGAQRYGPVASVIRFEDSGPEKPGGVMGIDFPDGSADWALGLEASELLRFDHKFSSDTIIVCDSVVVPPTNVRRVDGGYFSADEIERHYRALGCRVDMRDFTGLAERMSGNRLNANLLALGVLLGKMDGALEISDFAGLLDERRLALIGACL